MPLRASPWCVLSQVAVSFSSNEYLLGKADLLSTNDALPQLVELKSGETYNGHMVDCDTFMNVTLRDVYLTSPDGEKFWKLKEVYIRGNVVSVGFYKLMSIATSPTRVAQDRSSHCYLSIGRYLC